MKLVCKITFNLAPRSAVIALVYNKVDRVQDLAGRPLGNPPFWFPSSCDPFVGCFHKSENLLFSFCLFFFYLSLPYCSRFYYCSLVCTWNLVLSWFSVTLWPPWVQDKPHFTVFGSCWRTLRHFKWRFTNDDK